MSELRTMGDVVAAISESRLVWIKRVQDAFCECHDCEGAHGYEVPVEEWERLRDAIMAPCRLKDGIEELERHNG